MDVKSGKKNEKQLKTLTAIPVENVVIWHFAQVQSIQEKKKEVF